MESRPRQARPAITKVIVTSPATQLVPPETMSAATRAPCPSESAQVSATYPAISQGRNPRVSTTRTNTATQSVFTTTATVVSARSTESAQQ
ncbi:hypothetical protein [Herbidospora mongoliensis]|uniref:hypothetical protein n=1 Tax=Herbidospora mongoliensis TaxID=688067 RepID=UPI00082AA0A0|nr:hypothetical protein [Herbidospora mongoliensis]